MLRHLVRARGAVRHHARSAAPATSAASLQPRWYEPPKLSDTIRYAATNAAVNAALVSAAASNLAAASSGVGEGVDAAIGAAVLLGGAAASRYYWIDMDPCHRIYVRSTVRHCNIN